MHEQRYDQLKAQLTDIDWIRRGSIIKRYMPCGTKTCRCQANPPQLHGPYYQWSHTVDGKAKSVRLTREQAHHVQTWINNGRRLNDIVKQMELVSYKHTEHLLQKTTQTPTEA